MATQKKKTTKKTEPEPEEAPAHQPGVGREQHPVPDHGPYPGRDI